MKFARGLILFFLPVILFAQENNITFSEIMFYPALANSEFIEIYNLSDSSIDLSGWKFKYQNSNEDFFVSTGDGLTLNSGQYAIIFEGDYNFQTGNYAGLIPDEALVLKTEDNSFGTNGMANTSDRVVYLINPLDEIIQEYTYSANNSTGFSDEKIILTGENNNENWGNSLTSNGSPGSQNSVSPFDFDLQIGSFFTDDEYYKINTPFDIYTVIKNKGIKPATDYIFKIFIDYNRDSLFTVNEEYFSHQYFNLLSGDSLLIQNETALNDTGSFLIKGEIVFEEDQLTFNNISLLEVSIYDESVSSFDVVFNEIKYMPRQGEPEWVELLNTSPDTINLKGWHVSDKTTSTIITYNEYYLPPDSFVVLSDNENILDFYPVPENKIIEMNLPSLNNTGDNLKLTNPYSTIIDSVNYLPEWGGNNGYSLERINSARGSNDTLNWGSCYIPLTGTPGFVNSLSPKEHDLFFERFAPASLYFTPTEAPDINISIRNTGLNFINGFTISIYNDTNHDSLASSSEKIYEHNYGTLPAGVIFEKMVSLDTFPVGMFNLIGVVTSGEDSFNYNDTIFTELNIVKLDINFGDIIINEIMYSPDGEPEWIELSNRNSETVLFRGFSVADLKDTISLDVSPFPLELNGYAVFAEEDINEIYKANFVTHLTDLPSLNNSGDRIYLLDSLNRIIDSLVYLPQWGGKDGISLEKIDSDNFTQNSENFGSSISPEGGTPSTINSLSLKDYDLSINSVLPDKPYYEVGNSPVFTVLVKNIGKYSSGISELKLTQNDELNSSITLPDIPAKDSLEVFLQSTPLASGKTRFKLFHNFDLDNYLWNDTLTLDIFTVSINEVRSDLIINEIMFAPTGDMPEWFEIYNRSDKTINLKNYRVADNRDTISLKTGDFLLYPSEYLLISADSMITSYFNITEPFLVTKLPTLNNSGDKIVLLDSLYRVIDSLDYTGFDYKTGKSVERISHASSSADSTNWGITNVKYGGTPGAVNSLSEKDFDLGIIETQMFPLNPAEGDSISFGIFVNNSGIYSSQCSLNIFKDNNIIFTASSGEIMPESKYVFNTGALFQICNKIEKLTFVIYGHEDDYRYNDTIITNISPGIIPGAIVINEIFPAPNNNHFEWIELYNSSESEINLKGLLFVDASGNENVISDTNLLEPGEYIIISADSSLKSLYPEFQFDQIITSLPGLNNEADILFVIDSTGVVLDSARYEKNKITGVSLERISSNSSGFDLNNWGYNKYSFGGSPGYLNSVSKKENDLELVKIYFSPEQPRFGDLVDVFVKIFNNGNIANSPFIINYEIDSIENSSTFDSIISPGDTINYQITEGLPIRNGFTINAKLLYNDEDGYNNKYSSSVFPGSREGELVISEIYANPSSGEAEWVEVFNPGPGSVNIEGWQISEIIPDIKFNTISNDPLFISPGKYFLVTTDTGYVNKISDAKSFQVNFGNLNNSGDGIILADKYSLHIDSVYYDFSLAGYSLEKLNSSGDTRWINSISPQKSTPGFSNSIDKYVPHDFGAIIINEILYEPLTGKPEFIEIYNNARHDLSITGFNLEVNNNSYPLYGTEFIISANQFFVIATDSSFLKSGILTEKTCCVLSNISLPNDGGKIKLTGVLGEYIDSVDYSPGWHNKFLSATRGVSLEKLSPDLKNDHTSWSSSADISGSTPGEQNSIYSEYLDDFTGIKAEPNPFSPDNDGFEDFTKIVYSLKFETAVIKVKIFDDRGRLVRLLADNQPVGKKGTILFDGRDDSGIPLRIGIYIVLFEAADAKSNDKVVYKLAIVSARKF